MKATYAKLLPIAIDDSVCMQVLAAAVLLPAAFAQENPTPPSSPNCGKRCQRAEQGS